MILFYILYLTSRWEGLPYVQPANRQIYPNRPCHRSRWRGWKVTQKAPASARPDRQQHCKTACQGEIRASSEDPYLRKGFPSQSNLSTREVKSGQPNTMLAVFGGKSDSIPIIPWATDQRVRLAKGRLFPLTPMAIPARETPSASSDITVRIFPHFFSLAQCSPNGAVFPCNLEAFGCCRCFADGRKHIPNFSPRLL